VPELSWQDGRRRNDDGPLEVGRRLLEHRRSRSETHGKKDLITTSARPCLRTKPAAPSATSASGWKDKNFDFGNPKNIDCLACHDQTGTYKKGATTAGATGANRQPVARGTERRAECRRAAASDMRVLPRQGGWR